MAIPRSTAKKLSTDTEYRLVNESFAPHVSQLTEKGLAQRIQRARTARDKYRSLAQRQTREARGRIDPRGTRAAAGNKNTVVKQQLFDETLARYEKQSQAAGKKSATARNTAAAGKKAASSVKKTAGKAAKAAKKVTGKASGKTSAAAGASAVKKSARKTAAGAAAKSSKASGTAKKSAPKSPAAKPAATKSATTKSAARKPSATKSATKKSAAGKLAKSGKAPAVKKSDATQKTAVQSANKSAAQPTSRSEAKSASKPAGRKSAPQKRTSQADSGKSSTAAAGKKKAGRTPASRAGTITKPVKIPPLAQVVAAVSNVVAVRKEEAQNAVPAPPTRSAKAPAQTNDGAPPGAATVPAAGVNPKGPDFPRNAHERGRLGAAVKRQQARRDTR